MVVRNLKSRKKPAHILSGLRVFFAEASYQIGDAFLIVDVANTVPGQKYILVSVLQFSQRRYFIQFAVAKLININTCRFKTWAEPVGGGAVEGGGKENVGGFRG